MMPSSTQSTTIGPVSQQPFRSRYISFYNITSFLYRIFNIVCALPQPPKSDFTSPSNIGDKGIKARACLAPSLRSFVLELKQTRDETAPELPNHWHHAEPIATPAETIIIGEKTKSGRFGKRRQAVYGGRYRSAMDIAEEEKEDGAEAALRGA